MTTTKPKAAAAARIGAALAARKRGELLALLRPCFPRVEPWLQAGKYVAAVASDVPGRNGWTIAQQAGDRAPQRTQRLLDRGLGYLRGEEDFEFSKGCFGLDQSQVRLYTAIARHTVLVMAALAICAITAAQLKDRTGTQAPPPVHPDQPPPADPGMTPLTVPEITRLLTTPPARPGLAEHWANWRRGHQARARWYHHRARLARGTTIALVS